MSQRMSWMWRRREDTILRRSIRRRSKNILSVSYYGIHFHQILFSFKQRSRRRTYSRIRRFMFWRDITIGMLNTLCFTNVHRSAQQLFDTEKNKISTLQRGSVECTMICIAYCIFFVLYSGYNLSMHFGHRLCEKCTSEFSVI